MERPDALARSFGAPDPGDEPPPLAVPLPVPITPDRAWLLVETGFVPAREHEVESLFAVSNGFLGMRGSLAEGVPMGSPATFIAGLYDLPGGFGAVPELARLPDPSRLVLTVGDHPVRIDAGTSLEHRRVLDLRQGILWREWVFKDASGRTTRLRELRLASMADRRLLVQCVEVTPDNYSAPVSVQGAMVRPLRLDTRRGGAAGVAVWSGVQAVPGTDPPSFEPHDGDDRTVVPAEFGRTFRVDRVHAVVASRNGGPVVEQAGEHLRAALARGDVDDLVRAHRDAWAARWRDADVRIEGDPASQLALRFSAYHLMAAANPEDDRVSIGARALTSNGYKGHAFWDTEIFMLPFFTFTWPEAARSLVTYRWHTLPAARARARARGWPGALYAWESADTGEDVTPPFLIDPEGKVTELLVAKQEQHISADVAWGVWSYWHATHDHDFLRDAGAEVILETARFWAGRGVEGPDGKLHIPEVIGPDEYHESVDDNAFTNGMAAWNLECGARVARWMAEKWPDAWGALCARTGLSPDEPASWPAVAARLYTGFDERTGLFEQFRGYFGLERVEVPPLDQRSAAMEVLLGRERIQKTQVIKQADVVMLIALLWDRFPPAVREANFRFYDPRTGHGSSLSPAIHALVAARLGLVDVAARDFRLAAEIDLANNMGNSSGGVHAAACGGLWQAAVFGFGGLVLDGDVPRLDPRLPPAWRSLECAIRWRGRRFELSTVGDRREEA